MYVPGTKSFWRTIYDVVLALFGRRKESKIKAACRIFLRDECLKVFSKKKTYQVPDMLFMALFLLARTRCLPEGREEEESVFAACSGVESQEVKKVLV